MTTPNDHDTIEDFVPFFKAFCNGTRAQIVEFLLGGERCVCEMTGPWTSASRWSRITWRCSATPGW